jgi:hypothetical protein
MGIFDEYGFKSERKMKFTGILLLLMSFTFVAGPANAANDSGGGGKPTAGPTPTPRSPPPPPPRQEKRKVDPGGVRG